ncbi:MAG TPA: hypothetical protein VES69_09605 [Pyrinomonadaceae bacterium]|nr:hypothetical protein [Pyrinomonadaceae bacterium]
MFESMHDKFTGKKTKLWTKERQRDYERLHALLAELTEEKDLATAP